MDFRHSNHTELGVDDNFKEATLNMQRFINLTETTSMIPEASSVSHHVDLVDVNVQSPLLPPSRGLVVKYRLLFGLLLLFLITAGFFLNSVLAAVVWRDRKPRAPRILMFNLAFVDMLITAVPCLLLLYALFYGSWPLGDAGCRVYGFFFVLGGLGSLNTVTAIAVDRHGTLVWQHSARGSERHLTAYLAVTWGTALIWATLPLLGWSSFLLDNHRLVCAPNWTGVAADHKSYLILFSVLGLGAPVALKTLCYKRVYAKVTRIARKIHCSRSSVIKLATRLSRASRASVSSRTSRPSNISQPTRTSTCTVSSIGSADLAVGTSLADLENIVSKLTAQTNAYSGRWNERRLMRPLVCLVVASMITWWPYGITCLVALSVSNTSAEYITVASLLAKSCVVTHPVMYLAFNRKLRRVFFAVLSCSLPWSSSRVANTSPAFNDNKVSPESIVPTAQPSLARVVERSQGALSTIREDTGLSNVALPGSRIGHRVINSASPLRGRAAMYALADDISSTSEHEPNSIPQRELQRPSNDIGFQEPSSRVVLSPGRNTLILAHPPKEEEHSTSKNQYLGEIKPEVVLSVQPPVKKVPEHPQSECLSGSGKPLQPMHRHSTPEENFPDQESMLDGRTSEMDTPNRNSPFTPTINGWSTAVNSLPEVNI